MIHVFINIVVAIQCDALSDPDNGAVSVTGTGVGDTATYTCDDGYELIGSSTRTCQSNGEWSESSPTCEGIPKHSCQPSQNFLFHTLSPMLGMGSTNGSKTIY